MGLDKREVAEFFDRLAPTWDEMSLDRGDVIERILDNAGVAGGQDVLDVACGTGILFPYYLRRGVQSVTGVDISKEMVRIARAKYADEPRVRVCCADVEEAVFSGAFDCAVLYNAFPHFADGARLIDRLADMLRQGGRLTIAHGFSRDAINAHHSGTARRVSNGLIPVEEMRELFSAHFDVDVCVSDGEMYQVAGTKRR